MVSKVAGSESKRTVTVMGECPLAHKTCPQPNPFKKRGERHSHQVTKTVTTLGSCPFTVVQLCLKTCGQQSMCFHCGSVLHPNMVSKSWQRLFIAAEMIGTRGDLV
jgi:hypothetical protein